MPYSPTFRSFGCALWVVDVLSRGYRPRFLERPPLTMKPPDFGRLKSPKREIRIELVQHMLDIGAIEPVADLRSPGFYSLLFLVPKASGGWCPVIDLSRLNRYLDIPTFRMETAERIRSCLQPNSWVTSLDLKDAYHVVPYSDAPGLSEVPQIPDRRPVLSVLSSPLRHFDSPVAVYESQEFLFLGYQFNLVSYLCTPPRSRFLKICKLINQILAQQGSPARL